MCKKSLRTSYSIFLDDDDSLPCEITEIAAEPLGLHYCAIFK